jgi:hypothetical protein
MSPKGIDDVLTRAMNDAAFAELLVSNTDKALWGFDLTVEELVSLKTLSQTDLKKTPTAKAKEQKSEFAAQGNSKRIG